MQGLKSIVQSSEVILEFTKSLEGFDSAHPLHPYQCDNEVKENSVLVHIVGEV